MSKIAIIGIDGLDPLLLSRWRDVLPNFASLFDAGSDISVKSTFPPDSICAWASIYTGENPAEHGLIESINYLDDKKSKEDIDRSEHFRGKTFWDLAGNEGKSVCVINPFIAYPSWKVNGIMVSGPVFEGGDISTYPEDISEKYKFPPIGGIVDFPEEKDLGEFFERTVKVTEELADVGLQIYKDHRPDLYFLTFLTLDRMKHFFWRFTDKDDVYYPGKNPHEDSIKDFYVILDGIIGKFRDAIDEETVIMVLSDHGHRRRCTKCLNLNEILRQKGYLETVAKGASGAIKQVVERAKVFTVSSLAKLDLQDWIYRIAKFIPNRKALKKSTYLIDSAGSAVTLSNLCGTNPYGGLDIRPGSDGEYEDLREKVIGELMDLNDSLGVDAVKWAGKKEDLYSGRNDKRLPDVLFELHEEYGVGMDLFCDLITENFTHKKISGGHKIEAVLLISPDNGKINNVNRPDSLIGIKDYIMGVLSIS